MTKLDIGYVSEDVAPVYAKAIRAAKTKEALVEAIEPFERVADDALAEARKLTDAQFARLRMLLPKSRKAKGKEAEELATTFGAITMPIKMMLATMLADEMNVPWGLAVIRCEELGWPQLKGR